MKSSLDKSYESVKNKGDRYKLNVKKYSSIIMPGTLNMQNIDTYLDVGKDPNRFEGLRVAGGQFLAEKC